MKIRNLDIIILMLIFFVFLLNGNIQAKEQSSVQLAGHPVSNPPPSSQDKPDQEQSWEELTKKAIESNKAGKYEEAIKYTGQALKIAEETFGMQHPKTIASVFFLAKVYHSKSDYSKAEPLYKRALIVLEKAGKEHPITVTCLNDLGRLYYDQGRYSEAEPFFKRALEIREKVLGKEHPDVATNLDIMALLYYYLGRYAEAELICKRAIAIRERSRYESNPHLATSFNNLALIYWSTGYYSKAEIFYMKALAIVKKQLGPEHPNVATTLNNLGDLYNSRGEYSRAEQFYRESLQIREKVLGKDHPKVAECLDSLAMLYQTKGLYSNAEALMKKALDISVDKLGAEHPTTAIRLNNMANIYCDQSRYSDAESLYRKALAIDEKFLGKEHPHTAACIGNLAGLYQVQGRYSEAEPLYERTLAICEKSLGKEHRQTATCLNNLAELYKNQGRYSEAESFCKKALVINERALGKEHPDIAINMNNLAGLYQAQGRYSEAELLYNKTLKIVKKALGKKHCQTATCLNNLALLYNIQGRYSESEFFYNEALAINEKALGKEHPNTARSMINLSGLYYSQGRCAEAELLSKKALAIIEKALGKEHPDLAIILNNLGTLYHIQGRYSDTESLYKKALAINEKTLGNEHMHTAQSLNSIALLYYTKGRYSEAELMYKKSLTILEKVLGKDNPLVVTNLNNIATLYNAQGRYSEAESLFKRALAVNEKILGKEHPHTSLILTGTANVLISAGRQGEAFHLSLRANTIDENTILDIFKTSSEKQKFEFLATVQGNYEAFLSLIIKELSDKPDALNIGLNSILKRKGIVLEAISKERELILKSGRPEVRDTYKKLYEVTSVLSSLTLAGPGKMNMEEYRQRLDELRKEREELEKKLARMSSEFVSRKKTQLADCKTVSEKLPSGSVLVEYVNIHPYNFKAKGMENRWGEPEYYAFILPSSKDMPSGKAICPKLISLGKASDIDNAVSEYRKEIYRTHILWQDGILDEGEAEKRLAEKGKKLYDLVVAPIKDAVGDAKTLYIAPDGDLNLIPFGALQDETGKYLLENYRINYLSGGRDLVGYENKTGNNGKTLIIADPDYDMTGSDRVAASKTLLSAKEQPKQAEQTEEVALRGETRSRDLSLTKWNRLPGTRKEAEEISEILKGDNPKDYMDKSALEEIMKEVRSPRRLHIATHGFFMEDQDDLELLKAGDRRQNFMSEGGTFSGIPIKMENPLLRCGLVLAGANRMGTEKLSEGCDDGILTALEITGIPLTGTDLVVLSACETGVGKTRCGEGVFGLRRAFQLAGARTVVMSLWSVPDKQTQKLMTNYYQRMKNGESKSEALRNAKLAMMKSRRKETGSSHPFFWASFISVGEP